MRSVPKETDVSRFTEQSRVFLQDFRIGDLTEVGIGDLLAVKDNLDVRTVGGYLLDIPLADEA